MGQQNDAERMEQAAIYRTRCAVTQVLRELKILGLIRWRRICPAI